ncbi:MAG: 3-deoxy-manno-octulosonate cytidylyltransferase [Melioribacteraceae bacterium]|nr:3-deoxy-manno-octulosonate cytidylyltransferase [Melioribacteraceae bacterium]
MIVGVIPARYGSSRLEGKPLADICGKPMMQHTYESVKKSKLLNKVILAVDDERLYNAAKSFGANVMMTPKDIKTGSDRIAFVAKSLEKADIIVNIQGDEPFIKSIMIDESIEPLLFDHSIHVSTLAKKVKSIDELNSPDIPKVVFDYNNFALYFSRSTIPFVRDAKDAREIILKHDIYKHIGLYTYRRNALFEFTNYNPTDLELTEKLEQLRMLEHGMKIKVVITENESISVDTAEDLEKARLYYKNNF